MTDVERTVAALIERVNHRYYGKYRGIVVDNDDPRKMGRLRLRVPAALGPDVVTGWATACIPYGGSDQQGCLFIPDRGAGAWVEFEGGDREFPIWSGVFVSCPDGSTEAPKPNSSDGSTTAIGADPASRKIIKTAAGHTIQFEDASGSETVHIQEGVRRHRITMDAAGVTITDGQHGHTIAMDAYGITVQYAGSGDTLTIDASGIHLSGTEQHLVLGDQFQMSVGSFINALQTHTHMGNLGAPTSPPLLPMTLQVPLSQRHTVE